MLMKKRSFVGSIMHGGCTCVRLSITFSNTGPMASSALSAGLLQLSALCKKPQGVVLSYRRVASFLDVQGLALLKHHAVDGYKCYDKALQNACGSGRLDCLVMNC